MKQRRARTIHAFRSSGLNTPGYSRPAAPQQSRSLPDEAPAQQPLAPRTAPRRPQDARTPDEALGGLLRAAEPKLVTPRFTDTTGPWIRLGADQVRVPRDIVVATNRARDGRWVAVVAHLDSSDDAGRVQVLVSSDRGVLELVGLSGSQLREIRLAFVGR